MNSIPAPDARPLYDTYIYGLEHLTYFISMPLFCIQQLHHRTLSTSFSTPHHVNKMCHTRTTIFTCAHGATTFHPCAERDDKEPCFMGIMQFERRDASICAACAEKAKGAKRRG
ncbi:hypothetical protein PMIN05_001626 [Paraphaeosphaeria minitans]